MQFSEKLQQLRKQLDLTQEQLAEQLFVSRTAVSKWESGKGYPNIDSLVSISKIFKVSVDDLLSGEELVTLATSENRSNLRRLFSLVCGVIDLMALAFIFLPFYGQPEGTYIRSVTLLEYQNAPAFLYSAYWIILLVMVSLGVIGLIILRFGSEKWQNICLKCSLAVHAFAILLFAASNQPYVTVFLFLFFVFKLLIILKNRTIKN